MAGRQGRRGQCAVGPGLRQGVHDKRENRMHVTAIASEHGVQELALRKARLLQTLILWLAIVSVRPACWRSPPPASSP
jgi:hypothetical protein